MVCRESRLSSAMITLARGSSELSDREVIAINHALLQEAGQYGDITVNDWNSFIDSTIDRFSRGFLVATERSKDPVIRLEQARTQTPSYNRYYASTRLVERSVAIANGHREYLENYARIFGKSLQSVREEFEAMDLYAKFEGNLQASPAFVRAWETDPARSNLLADSLSRYKYEQMENNLKALTGTTEDDKIVYSTTYRPAVERRVIERGWISELGYDSINGRLEMVARQRPEKVYAYRMTQEEYDEIFLDRQEESLGKRFQLVKGNPDFIYADAEEREEYAYHMRCLSCGQYSGPIHYCPVLGSETILNRDTRVLVNQELEALGLPRLPESVGGPVVAGRRSRVFSTEDSDNIMTIRMSLSPKALAEEARKSPTASVRTNISIILADKDFGNLERASLNGQVSVEYEGRGKEYLVLPVRESGDSGVDQLKCNCDIYHATTNCHHLVLASESIATLIQGIERLSPRQDEVFEAAENARKAILESYESSLEASDRAKRRWKPVGKSYLENPELFQEFYEEALVAKRALADVGKSKNGQEYPVPYIKNNAFGGLGKRGARGFGTELEFEFPDTMSEEEQKAARATIGKALYTEGLTSVEHQLAYGSAREKYKSTHRRGWSFEEDPTIARGGEVVSPIMYDEPETWNNLEKVCDIITRHGGIPTENTGGHVHVGAGDFNHTVANHNRFFESYKENEDLLFRLSTNPEVGTHRSRLVKDTDPISAKTNSNTKKSISPNQLPSSAYASFDDIMDAKTRAAINTEHLVGESKDHLEFRSFDGSLNPSVIQAQIGISLYMTEAAIREDSTPSSFTKKAFPLGTSLANIPKGGKAKSQDGVASTEVIRKFIDRFVPGSEDGIEANNIHARQIISLFAITQWQSA